MTLHKRPSQRDLAHLKAPRDLFDVHLTAPTGSTHVHDGMFECPVTGVASNAVGVRFTALRRCGHVLSARALLMVQSSSSPT